MSYMKHSIYFDAKYKKIRQSVLSFVERNELFMAGLAGILSVICNGIIGGAIAIVVTYLYYLLTA